MKFINKIFVKIIQVIHLSLIIYIILGPFFENQLDNVITLLLFLLFRWITNNHECTLTKIENQITGGNEGFISRIVKPIYQLNESKLNYTIYIVTIFWLFILLFFKLKKLKK